MNAKHTPGPWRAVFGETTTIRDAQGGKLAICTYINAQGKRRDNDEVEKNAHVMAASALLYEVLERIQFSHEYDGGAKACPCCANNKNEGHLDNCPIGNALRAARGEK